MEHRDFLQLQIDQLGQALSKIFSKMLGIKEKDSLAESIESTSQSLKEEMGFTIDDFVTLDTENFIAILQEKNVAVDNFDKIADILLLTADELYELQPGNEKSKSLYLKCLKIYHHLQATDLIFPFERQLKVERIKNLVSL
jgi:hypothetical protein